MTSKAYSLDELLEVPIYDGFDDLPVDVGQPYTEVGTHDQESREDDQVHGLLGVVRGHGYQQELLDSCKENLIYVSFASL